MLIFSIDCAFQATLEPSDGACVVSRLPSAW